MKPLAHFLKAFKKIFAYGETVHPTRDWLFIMTMSVLLFAAGIVWHAFIFSSLLNGKTLGSTTLPAQSSTENSVSAVQTVFQKRAAEANHYQTDYHFVDPSL
jgi:hypothetical protein